jgi:hypothetical protein
MIYILSHNRFCDTRHHHGTDKPLYRSCTYRITTHTTVPDGGTEDKLITTVPVCTVELNHHEGAVSGQYQVVVAYEQQKIITIETTASNKQVINR